MTQTTTFNFLTQSWFDAVARLNQEVGELNLPPNLTELTINTTFKTLMPQFILTKIHSIKLFMIILWIQR